MSALERTITNFKWHQLAIFLGLALVNNAAFVLVYFMVSYRDTLLTDAKQSTRGQQ